MRLTLSCLDLDIVVLVEISSATVCIDDCLYKMRTMCRIFINLLIIRYLYFIYILIVGPLV